MGRFTKLLDDFPLVVSVFLDDLPSLIVTRRLGVSGWFHGRLLLLLRHARKRPM